jgi:suppressor of G2 allele of SKP1
LILEPLKGQINPEASEFTVGKVKVEIRLAKMTSARWVQLVGDAPDREYMSLHFVECRIQALATALASFPSTPSTSTAARTKHKNWEGITTDILSAEKEKTTDQDPNVGGDAALNGFFQKIFGDADEDTKRAMMKSYQESGGTTLSTNWDEVKKAPVEVKPPAGSEWKKWD